METLNFSAPNLGILVLTLLCITGIALATHQAKSRIRDRTYFKKVYVFYGIFFLSVLLLIGLSVSGFFYNFTALPPRSGVLLLVFLSFILFLSLQKMQRGLKLLLVLPAHWLVVCQVYRLGAELILAGLYAENIVPRELTWYGRNFDMFVALFAIPVALLLWKKYRHAYSIALLFNGFSLLSLANILFIAFFSLPSPFQKYETNLLTSYFPGILIPAFLAPLAVYISIVSLKQCLYLSAKGAAKVQVGLLED
ncbi:hypothetical protein WJR50_30020 [Catalinimonas sp. 4WD22]|uniref:hypothetical protein n=1 Tax=Catalinimonas locisalis TaxID=3133978 RepID=UPI00310101D1